LGSNDAGRDCKDVQAGDSTGGWNNSTGGWNNSTGGWNHSTGGWNHSTGSRPNKPPRFADVQSVESKTSNHDPERADLGSAIYGRSMGLRSVAL
jgi:hypothetical protein